MKRLHTLILASLIFTPFFHTHADNTSNTFEIIDNTPRQAILNLLDHIHNNTQKGQSSLSIGSDSQYLRVSTDRASVQVSKTAAVFGILGILKYIWNKIQNKKPEYQDLPETAKDNFRQYKTHDFKIYFETYFNTSTTNFTAIHHQLILQQYALYQFIEFIRYIETLPNYCEYIHSFYRLCLDSSLQYNMPELFKKEYHAPIFRDPEYIYPSVGNYIYIELEPMYDFLDLISKLNSNAQKQKIIDDKKPRYQLEAEREKVYSSDKIWYEYISINKEPSKPKIKLLELEKKEPLSVDEMQEIFKRYEIKIHKKNAYENPHWLFNWSLYQAKKQGKTAHDLELCECDQDGVYQAFYEDFPGQRINYPYAIQIKECDIARAQRITQEQEVYRSELQTRMTTQKLTSIRSKAQREADNPINNDDLIRHKNRIIAIQQITNNQTVWESNNYTFDPQTVQFMEHNNLNPENYVSFYGNQLQQALHTEIADLLQKVTSYQYTQDPLFKNIYDKKMLQSLAEAIEVARKANKSGEVDLAADLLDFTIYATDCINEYSQKVAEYFRQEIETAEIMAVYCARFSKGMAKGAAKGSLGFFSELADSAKHPIATVQNIGTGLYHCGAITVKASGKLLRYFQNVAYISQMLQDYPELLKDEIDRVSAENNAMYGEACEAISGFVNTVKNMEPEDLGEITGDFIARQALNRLTNIAVSRVSSGLIANQSKLVGVATKIGKVAQQTAAGIHDVVDFHTLELQVIKNIAVLKAIKNTKILKAATLVKLEQVKKILLETHELTKLHLTYKPLHQVVTVLKEKFNHVHSHENLSLFFNMEHILEGLYDKNGYFVGLHHDHLGFLRRNKYYEFVAEHAHGFYEGKILVNGKWKKKTFFPSHWPREKVLEKIIESVNESTHGKTEIQGIRKIITAPIKEGVELKTIIDTITGEIVTSMPILKRKK